MKRDKGSVKKPQNLTSIRSISFGSVLTFWSMSLLALINDVNSSLVSTLGLLGLYFVFVESR